MSSKHKPLYLQIFDDYRKTIADFAVKNSRTSYLKPNDIKGEWRQIVPYSADFENQLIQETKTFIALQRTNDTQLLKPVIGKISEFLAQYTVHQDGAMSQKAAARCLLQKLWDENKHIQHLIAKTEEKQKLKRSMNRHKRNQFEQAQKNKKLKQQRKNNRRIKQAVEYDVFRVAIIEHVSTHRK